MSDRSGRPHVSVPTASAYLAGDDALPLSRRRFSGVYMALRAAPELLPAGGAARVAPRRLDFGTLRIGRTKQRDITLRSTDRTQPLVIEVPEPALPFQGGSTYTLAPGGLLMVGLRFTPAAAGRFRETLGLSTSDPAHAGLSVRLDGRAH